ncbi:MAG: flagellar basal body P-ring formation protein FlgA [Planctomycetes bacterium]|nr:flagellar basal body P-ring formation protein FlgA [Planctomycetota bacterium]
MRTFIAIVAVVAVCGGLAFAEDPRPLKIYMPRNVVTDDDPLTLAAICLVNGDDPAMVAKAGLTALGRGAISGEQLTLDRTSILSRLATEGIQSGKVEFTGAEKVTIRRGEQTVHADRIIQAAEAFIKKNYHPGEEYRVELAGKPKEMVLPKNVEIEFKAQMAKNPPANHVKVEVHAVAGEKTVASADVLYKLVRIVTQLVAKEDIAAGQAVTPQNTKVEAVANSEPFLWSASPYGMVSAKPLKAGTIIDPSMVAMPKINSVVKRNQTVMMKIARDNFEIKAIGVAMQDGKAGELIKVKNADSNRIVTAKVIDDGTVEPYFEEDRK